MTWGFQGSIPIGNRAARGQYHRAKLEAQQEEQRLEQVKSNLMFNVRNAGLNVIANKLIIESSELNVELQELNVLAEEERLRLGTSTNQQVLEIQEDLTQAEVDLLVARVNAEKSLADLRLAEGTLLEEFGIKYDLPEIQKPLNSVDSFQDRENTWRKEKYREMGLVEE
jgi:outer membrane protein TolC